MQNQITLRPTTLADLELFFEFYQDPEAVHMAAFVGPEYSNREAYLLKWSALLQRPDVHNQTILLNNMVVGSMGAFNMFEETHVAYWLSRHCWNRGVASVALTEFLKLEKRRPLTAAVAFDNIGSHRVLEKNGFLKISSETGFAQARNMNIEEFIYELN